jgi:hypothetical protein
VGIATESYFLLQRDNMAVQGEEPFEEDLDWLKYGREMIQESPKILDDAAKIFLTLASTFLTVYTGALALFKFNERSHDPLSWLAICSPIILWLLCISSMAYVHFPDRLKFRKNSPSDIERVTVEVSRKKSFRLKVGSALFVAALAATSISIVWLSTQPAEDVKKVEQTVHWTIAGDETGISGNLSIMGADVLVMLNEENESYRLQSAPGRDAKRKEVSAGRRS